MIMYDGTRTIIYLLYDLIFMISSISYLMPASIIIINTDRETDLDNVLQVHSVFVNVSKGQLAAQEDVEKSFRTTDTNQVILEILKKGSKFML